MSRSTRLVSVGAAFLALMLISPSMATALPMRTELSQEERAAGLWYADRMKFDQIREQGLTGKGITIAVIDDGINLDVPELQGADIEVRGQFCRDKETGEELSAETDDPKRTHGTNVVAMLVGNGVAGDGGPGTRGIVPDAKILFYATGSATFRENGAEKCEAYDPDTDMFESDRETVTADPGTFQIFDAGAFAVSQAIEDGADIVSVSSVAVLWESEPWAIAQILAMRAGVPFVAGSPNPIASGSLDYRVPYELNGVVAVGGVDNDGKLIRGYNIWGTEIIDAEGASNLTFVGPGSDITTPASLDSWGPALSSGTSLATPLVAGTIALGLEKYPSASGNQVLQVMIRTTGQVGLLPEPEWQGPQYGYGIVNPIAMLAVDPTQYAVENPLFIYDLGDPRCGENVQSYEKCAWGYALPTTSDVWFEDPSGQDPEKPGNSGMNLLVIVAIGLGALVLISLAVIVPIVIVHSRKKHETVIDNAVPEVRN